MRAAPLACMLAVLLAAIEIAEAARPQYEVDATVEPDHGVIHGHTRLRFHRHGSKVLLHLYPNRFRSDGDEVNDMTRGSVYPRGVFDPGYIEIQTASLPSGKPLDFHLTSAQGLAPQTLLEIQLPAASDSVTEIEIKFRTQLPRRLGPFGITEQGLTAVGGWHPYLVARDPGGDWRVDWAPAPADFSIELRAPERRTVVLGDAVFAAGHSGTVHHEQSAVRNVALLLPQAPQTSVIDAGDTTLTVIETFEPRQFRLGWGPVPDERFERTVVEALKLRPSQLPVPPHLTVAQVPLRWNLTTQSDAPIVVSDRALHVHQALEGFHAAQIAQTLYAALLQPRIVACEEVHDQNWVQQGIAWHLADQFLDASRAQHFDVNQWLRWLDFIAIVDRFGSAPKIPFASAFFENSLTDDELHQSIFAYGRREPPSRLSFARLRRSVGEPALQRAIDNYIDHLDGPCLRFTRALRESSGESPTTLQKNLDEARSPVVPDGPRARVDSTLRPTVERSKVQFVLDSADVDVSSSEFGLGLVFVLRKRDDYTKDIVFVPYFSERSYGIRLGPRFHFGTRNDPSNYRNNLLIFYQLSGLDTEFRDDEEPDIRSSGGIGGFGIRYDYSNVYWFDNPTEKRSLRLFLDGYDRSLGGDYSFLRYGARVRATTKLGSPNTIAAIELLGGFEQSLSSRGIPVQEQYSLGGQKSIRGISVNQALGENLALMRLELRQDLYPVADWNLADFFAYRRPQIRLFLDSGNVDDSVRRTFNPRHWAIGGGVGVSVLYDFMGFFPGSAYLELATRLDRDQGEVQVLFGTRQAF